MLMLDPWKYTSYEVALEVVQILRKLISDTRSNDARDLMKQVRDHGKDMVNVIYYDYIVGNMVRKVLKIIREEHARCQGENRDIKEESMQKLFVENTSNDAVDNQNASLKTNIFEALTELIIELETSKDNIISQASHHIHSNEIILTFGYSSIVFAFFKKASKSIKFQVIVVEDAPSCDGQKMALKLAENKIETTLINDSAAFAMMARVNKVIIGTNAIMADGGLRARCGTHNIALAAKRHSVPVITCSAMYKLSPEYLRSSDQSNFNQLASPHNVLNFSDMTFSTNIQVVNPLYDYVPPDLVTLIISNIGGNSPTYIYRLLKESYHLDDYVL